MIEIFRVWILGEIEGRGFGSGLRSHALANKEWGKRERWQQREMRGCVQRFLAFLFFIFFYFFFVLFNVITEQSLYSCFFAHPSLFPVFFLPLINF